MMLAAASAAAATFVGLYGIAGVLRPASRSDANLIRDSTLSPVEWRQRQRGLESWYKRWLQPSLVLWGERLRLRPASLDHTYLIQCGIDPQSIDGIQFRVLKLAGGLTGAVLGALVALPLLGTPLLLPVLAWAGYVSPSRYLSYRRRQRQRAIYRELPEVVGMVRAFVVAGMPLERTLHLISADTQAPGILKAEIRAVLARYGLGASIEEALQEMSKRTGSDDLALLIGALAQTKRLGTSLEQTLRDQELMVRMNQRNRSTAEAARVGTKLLGVLAGIYLPEFVILIMVPLFWGIIQRAFG